MFRKIIILAALFLTGSFFYLSSVLACPIDSPCKADISGDINNSRLNDRVIPNNLDKVVRPQNSMEMREQTIHPQVQPDFIPEKVEKPQTYDANCQFGNCMNKAPESEVSR